MREADLELRHDRLMAEWPPYRQLWEGVSARWQERFGAAGWNAMKRAALEEVYRIAGEHRG